MLKKLLYFTTILLVATLFLNISYATDIVMDLNTTTNSVENSTSTITDTNTIDNTTIGYEEDSTTDITQDFSTPYEESTTTTTTDYDDGTELSVSNIINIILISVGVVLILLGIAIILKLK